MSDLPYVPPFLSKIDSATHNAYLTSYYRTLLRSLPSVLTRDLGYVPAAAERLAVFSPLSLAWLVWHAGLLRLALLPCAGLCLLRSLLLVCRLHSFESGICKFAVAGCSGEAPGERAWKQGFSSVVFISVVAWLLPRSLQVL